MSTVQIYSTAWCPYCVRAKLLLKRRGVPFVEHDVTEDEVGRARLVEQSGGRRTVPQIWIGSTHVGGFDDLAALDRQGGLQPLLEREGISTEAPVDRDVR
jgi:glutaredoxin 3